VLLVLSSLRFSVSLHCRLDCVSPMVPACGDVSVVLTIFLRTFLTIIVLFRRDIVDKMGVVARINLLFYSWMDWDWWF
jgi:hypothetical protein